MIEVWAYRENEWHARASKFGESVHQSGFVGRASAFIWACGELDLLETKWNQVPA